ALAPSERAAFLEHATGGDDVLRRAVESLLRSDQGTPDSAKAPVYIETSAASASGANLKVGTKIAQYRIVKLIGVGGMGQVYLAEDSNLHRKVSLKFLSVKFTQDRERLHRFEQEARAASALNHPNILTIHEIGE